jgi:anaerobic selenocysteine-containing dehydrogenase
VSQANFRIAPLARRDSASGFDLDHDACELVQFRPAVVAPRGEARADIDIVFDLAGRFTRSVSWSDLLTQAFVQGSDGLLDRRVADHEKRRVVMMTPRRRLTPTIPATRKASEHSDFSGCTTWAVKGKDLFLDDRQAASDVGAPAVGSRHGVIARVRPNGWVAPPGLAPRIAAG